MRETLRYVPATLLAVGCVLLLTIRTPPAAPMRRSLAALPTELEGLRGVDQRLTLGEEQAGGATEYLLRNYGEDSVAFSVYVGYYERQARGRTIHSPKNCLPGSGWEALSATTAVVPVEARRLEVNSYILSNGKHRALVFYWYQGRGRVVADEYAVKWHLLRDAAITGRSEEALVRIVVPLPRVASDSDGDARADRLARRLAQQLIPEIEAALPEAG